MPNGSPSTYPGVAQYRHQLGEILAVPLPHYAANGRHQEARERLERAVEHIELSLKLDAGNETYTKCLAQKRNNLAWFLATCPDANCRDPQLAVQRAASAIELQPNDGMLRNTLGAAYYRNEQYSEALDAFTKSMELRSGGDSFDWFFLAMLHHKLGNREQAQDWYTKAVDWMTKNRPDDEELARFRDEAAALINPSSRVAKLAKSLGGRPAFGHFGGVRRLRPYTQRRDPSVSRGW